MKAKLYQKKAWQSIEDKIPNQEKMGMKCHSKPVDAKSADVYPALWNYLKIGGFAVLG